MTATNCAPDEGAFSFVPGVAPEQLRHDIRGWEFRTTKLLLQTRRSPEDLTGPFLVGIHRDVFGKHFPEQAGRFRTCEAHFGARAGAPPEQIEGLMQQLVANLAAHLEEVKNQPDPELKINRAFLCAALDHAEMIRIHPFVDGNGRWARIATNAFLYDCGFPVGTLIPRAKKRDYIAAVDRCIDDQAPGDLANLLLLGYVDVIKKRTSP